MSFSHPPFEAVLLHTEDDPRTAGLEYWFECSSCGGGWKTRFLPTSPISGVWTAYLAHLEKSHNLTPPKPKCTYSQDVKIPGLDMSVRVNCVLDEHKNGLHKLESDVIRGK